MQTETLDYHDAARKWLARKLWELKQTRSLLPPFEVYMTGSDEDDLIAHFSMSDDGTVEDLSGGSDQPVVGEFPLKVTITDATGNGLEFTLERDSLVQ